MKKYLIVIAAALLGLSVIAAVLLALSEPVIREEKGTTETASASDKENRVITGEMVTIIGDSISVMTADKMRMALLGVDIQAQNGKTADTDQEDNPSGLTLAKALADNGGLREVVIFALGSNNRESVGTEPLDAGTFRELHEITGDRTVFLVTNVSVPQSGDFEKNNQAMKAAARKYEDWHVIDWAATVESLPDPAAVLSEEDLTAWEARLHPTDPEGIDLWVQLIVKALSPA